MTTGLIARVRVGGSQFLALIAEMMAGGIVVLRGPPVSGGGQPAQGGKLSGSMCPRPPPSPRSRGRITPDRAPRTIGRVISLGFLLPTMLSAAESPSRRFDLPAGDAAQTLKQFAIQAGEQILYSAQDVGGLPTNALAGEYPPLEAIERMLKGTPLRAREDPDTRALAVTRLSPPVPASGPTTLPSAKSNDLPTMKNRPLLSLLAGWLVAGAAANGQVTAGAAAADPLVRLETVTVTGSNLRRLEHEKVLPVTLIDTASIEARDPSTPAELLVGLPQVMGLPGNEVASAGAVARGDNSAIALRGLGTGNSLILLNGRRLAPHPISQSENNLPALSVNVNQLPNRGIDHVEVLRDGASSVYGTDAVAGVVNYVMRRDLRGDELRARFGRTTAGDGTEWRATALTGREFAGGRGRLLSTLDFYHRDVVFLQQRAFSANSDLTSRAPAPWNDVSQNSNFFQSTSQGYFGNFSTGTISAATGAFTATRPAGVPAALATAAGAFFLVPTSATSVAFRTATPARTGIEREWYLNQNLWRVIQPRTARVNWFTQGEFDLGRQVTAFADFSFYQAKSTTYREHDNVNQPVDGNMFVPASNPYNPFGTRFWDPNGAPNADGTPRLTGTPSVVRLDNKRFTDFGLRIADITDQVYRGVAGLRGRFLESWSWESAVLYSRARVTDLERGAHRKSLMQQALNRSDAAALNPFGYNFAVQGGTLVITTPFTNPAAVMAPFEEPFKRDGITRLASADLRAGGDLFPLWGGNQVAAALGAEYRFETYDDFRPPFAGLNPAGSGLDPTLNDFLNFSPNSDTHAKRHILAAYAEAVVPVVGRRQALPLVQSLELSASGRFEQYTDFGRTTKPKLGANWRPTSWLMLRASYNQGFRAPNLAQLFTGSLVRSATNADTYRNVVTNLPIDGTSVRRSVRSGNQSLRPEVATGKSGGMAIEVPRLRGLSFSVDYWEIRQKDVIGASGSVADDTTALIAATQAALAAGQGINAIDLGSGTGSYKGDPSIVRLPLTPADKDFFAAYNATRPASAQRAAVGAIDLIRQTYFNQAALFLNGIDFDVTYRLPNTRLGSFTASTSWAYLINYFSYDKPGSPKRVLIGTNGAASAATRWRGNATLNWRRQAWTGALGAYYVGRFQDTATSTTKAVWESLGRPSYIAEGFSQGVFNYRYVVRDSISYNANLNYRLEARGWLRGTTVRLGVVNLFKAEPPLSSDYHGYDVATYSTLARGRSWSLELAKSF